MNELSSAERRAASKQQCLHTCPSAYVRLSNFQTNSFEELLISGPCVKKWMSNTLCVRLRVCGAKTVPQLKAHPSVVQNCGIPSLGVRRRLDHQWTVGRRR